MTKMSQTLTELLPISLTMLVMIPQSMGSFINDIIAIGGGANDFVTTTYMQLYKRSKKLGKSIQSLKNRDVIDR